MTIKGRAIWFWGLIKSEVRELSVGDTTIINALPADPFSKEGVATFLKVVNPDEMTVHSQWIGPLNSPEKDNIRIGKERKHRLVKSEINEVTGSISLGDLISPYREEVWWEPSEIGSSPERGK